MTTVTMTVDCGMLGENDIVFDVKYTPGTPDVMYLSNGDPGYPGDPAELEVLSATCNGVDISKAFRFEEDPFYDILCEKAWEAIEAEAEDAAEAYASERKDVKRDLA